MLGGDQISLRRHRITQEYELEGSRQSLFKTVWYDCTSKPMTRAQIITWPLSKLLWTPWGKGFANAIRSKSSTLEDGSRRSNLALGMGCPGEGNGNPLQYSCLENPVEGGAWWAAVHGVAQSRTRLKRLSSSNPLTYSKGQDKEPEFCCLLVDVV